jgi:hypothetical protein
MMRCDAHAPYCLLRPVRLCSILQHYLINGKIFEKKMLLNIRCVFHFFPTILFWNISHSNKKRAQFWSKCMLTFMYSTRYSYPILLKLGFSRHIFEKYSNIKFHGNPSSGRRIVPCGRRDRRTDRHDELLPNRLKISYIFFLLRTSLHWPYRSGSY